jgi:hypothetical protein
VRGAEGGGTPSILVFGPRLKKGDNVKCGKESISIKSMVEKAILINYRGRYCKGGAHFNTNFMTLMRQHL